MSEAIKVEHTDLDHDMVPTPNIAQILAGLRRRKLNILLTIVLLAGPTIALIASLPAKYTAAVSVLVDTRKSKFSDLQAESGAQQSDDMAVRSQLDVLQSTGLASEVTSRLKLAEVPEFSRRIEPQQSILHSTARSAEDWLRHLDAPQGLWLAEAIGPILSALAAVTVPPEPLSDAEKARQTSDLLLANKMTFVNGGRSYVISIRAKTEDPELSAAIANAYADAYLQLTQRIKSDGIRRAHAWFDERLVGLQTKVLQAEHEAEAFRQQNGLIEDRAAGQNSQPGRPVTVAGQQLAQVNAQLVATTSERAQKEASLEQIQGALRGRGDLDAIPAVVASPLIHALREQDAQLSGQAASLATSRMAANPELKSMQAQQREVRRKISDAVSKISSSIANEARTARAHETMLRDTLAQLKAQVSNEGSAEIRLRDLQQLASTARAVYDGYVARYQHTANEIGMQEPDAELVDRASVPLRPASPTKMQLTILAFIVSCVIALTIALLRTLFETGTRSTEEIEARTGYPAIGFLPSVRHRQAALQLDRQAMSHNEAINTARSMIQFGTRGQHPKVIMVTSALPQEGKTFFAASLARAVAMSGSKVPPSRLRFKTALLGRGAWTSAGARARNPRGTGYRRVAVPQGHHYFARRRHYSNCRQNPTGPPFVIGDAGFDRSRARTIRSGDPRRASGPGLRGCSGPVISGRWDHYGGAVAQNAEAVG